MENIRTTSRVLLVGFLFLGLVLGANSDAHAQFTPVDLNTWTEESYPFFDPAHPSWNPGEWAVSADGLSVVESRNGQSTLFYSDFSVFGTTVEATIEVNAKTWDDDFIGFALGFQPGDTTNPDADYLLIDWKRRSKWYDYPDPSCTPGSSSALGLAVSRVFGVPTADEFYGHINFDSPCSDSNSGLEELARGYTLGSTGWTPGQQYLFRFEYSATSLKVYVDGNLEIDITGDFNDGRITFYNFSQAGVTHNCYVESVLNVGIDIKPGSDPNCYNNDGLGVIPVAILGSDIFDVTQIDIDTVEMEGMTIKAVGKSGKLMAHIEDINDDGFDDLVVQIEDQPGVFDEGEGVAIVTGSLLDGGSFEGSDFICVTQ